MIKEYYNKIFETHDDSSWEKAPGKDVIIQAIRHFYEQGRIRNEMKIVDIGCGTGFFLNRIATEISPSLALNGVDISDTAIQQGEGRYPDLHLFCADGSKTPLAGGEFDVLVSYGSYEHFQDPRSGLCEAARLLKGGGLFFAMMPTLGIDRTDRNDEGWYEERQVPGSPVRQMQWNLKRETWESYFSESGLKLFEIAASLPFGALKPGVFFFGEK